jgi:hypothetical protein
MSDLDNTLEERGTRYGELIDNGGVAQALKKVFRAAPNWSRLAADQQEALDQIASKVSRALTGDPEYSDNWHDIAGYATLVDERLSRPKAKAQTEDGRQA